MVNAFFSAVRCGICGDMGNRYVNSNSQRQSHSHNNIFSNTQMAGQDRRSIWYIDANNLYGYSLVQKLPYKDICFNEMAEHDHRSITLDEVLNTDDDSYGWVICDLK